MEAIMAMRESLLSNGDGFTRYSCDGEDMSPPRPVQRRDTPSRFSATIRMRLAACSSPGDVDIPRTTSEVPEYRIKGHARLVL
jgi:hypothetical protein